MISERIGQEFHAPITLDPRPERSIALGAALARLEDTRPMAPQKARIIDTEQAPSTTQPRRQRTQPTVLARLGNSLQRRRGLRIAAVVTLIVVIASTAGIVWSSADFGSSVCSAMSTPVHRLVNPGSGVSILTTSTQDARSASERGYSQDLGVLFNAATSPAPGLSPIHSFYNPKTTNSVYIKESRESRNAVYKYGYRDEGIAFYAFTAPVDCAIPVYRFVQGNVHRFVVEPTECSAPEGLRMAQRAYCPLLCSQASR